MINTIIFDFGNVFINLDIDNAIKKTLETLGIETLSEEMIAFNAFYEQGLISTDEFVEFYMENFPKLTQEELIDIWNFIIKDFPKHRLEFIQQLKKEDKFKLILLSNTNELHIDYIKQHVPFYEEFKSCFDAFYLSQEINLRKPNKDIFEFVLNENKLDAHTCLFIDDNESNIKTALNLGLKTWHITPYKEDVVNLFKTKGDLF